jgi:PAS domain-containing protein
MARMKSELLVPKIPELALTAHHPILLQFDAMQIGWQLSPAVFVAPDTWKIVMANPPAETLFGYALGEMTLLESVNELVAERFRALHTKHLRTFASEPHTTARPMGQGLPVMGWHAKGYEFPCTVALYRFVNNEHRFVLAQIVDMRTSHASHGISQFVTKDEMKQEVKDQLKDSGAKQLADANLFG